MSKTVTSRTEIPDTPYYVLSNDTFMSGWGPCGDEFQAYVQRRQPRRNMYRINTVILPCDNWNEAKQVAEYAENRTDQKYVRVVGNKPQLRSGHVYSLMSRESAIAWYPERG